MCLSLPDFLPSARTSTPGTLPITSLSSVIGMNVIVNESTRWVPLTILLVIMLIISLTLLRWAHKQGWW